MLMMDVPSPTNYGESVELICSYQLDGDKLYSVKWYKDDVEFFRYVPNDWPPGQFLPIQGVRVDLSKSGSQSVYLRHVDLNSAGIYRCEVSAEAPEFQTVEAEKEMKVLVLPTEGPRITGGLPKYKVGDIVLVNCTSSKSKPAANLEWYINDELITGKKESLYQLESATTFHLGGLESSSLSLKFRVNEQHFHKGNMKLKCTATISRVYTMSNEELVFRQQSSGLHIMENMSRVRNTSSKIFHTNMEQYTVIAYLMLNILGRLMPDFWTRILYPFIVQ
nr:uncharacterized protein LOC107441168 [Parasteatoda tepidariorum]